MRRSRAFVLSELLMTMLLQAGFILVLCTSFYLLTSFYTKTQQVLTARNHAERVIQFMDDKIRGAGLGLWRCSDSAEIRTRLYPIEKLKTKQQLLTDPKTGYKLPVSLSWIKENGGLDAMPETSYTAEKFAGDVLVLLYAQRDYSSTGSGGIYNSNNEVIMTFSKESDFDPANGTAIIKNLDDDQKSLFFANCEITKDMTNITRSNKNLKRWAVVESIGVPFYVPQITEYPKINIKFYGTSSYPLTDEIKIPDAGEMMYLKCIQIFVHKHPDDGDRQLAFRELNKDGDTWFPPNGYNQEKGILDIYMELDTTNHVFTLYVLASGGEDSTVSNQRPAIWPNKANPIPKNKNNDDEISDDEAKKAWLDSDYCHHVIYVARKSWKLNNLEHFTKASWN